MPSGGLGPLLMEKNITRRKLCDLQVELRTQISDNPSRIQPMQSTPIRPLYLVGFMNGSVYTRKST